MADSSPKTARAMFNGSMEGSHPHAPDYANIPADSATQMTPATEAVGGAAHLRSFTAISAICRRTRDLFWRPNHGTKSVIHSVIGLRISNPCHLMRPSDGESAAGNGDSPLRRAVATGPVLLADRRLAFIP